jgi:penicillin-binding protein 1A
MRSMMQDVIRHGTGRRALELKREDIGGKTGTTNDFKDAWFSGFNQDVVATAWVGYDQPDTLGRGEAGSRAALPIWIDYMRVALKGLPQKPFPVPENVVSIFVDPETGRAVHAKMVSTLPSAEVKQDKPAEGAETPQEGDANPVADTSDFDDPDESNKTKLTPIEEYFIAGTEPKVEITESGEQKPVETTNPTESMPGLF